MPLKSGQRLGSYEVTAAIGKGGMGEVFRAKDTKLGRDVAIKVLPAAFANEPERLARFEREARVLASLNHTNIAHIYGFESASPGDGTNIHFLVMEMVEGEDLAARLKRGAVPVDEVITIAGQIAEGLEEAHEHGIVHRDLKPANIKIDPDGKVKILDFGLAKAMEPASAASSNPNVSHSPTLTHQATVAGMILGTAAYMSPEQARGRAVDKRADIWSFGVVLFEMLTGRRLFAGETVSDVLASVLKTDPDFGSLPPDVPDEVRTLLRRCLDRDVKVRLRDIGDARWSLVSSPDRAKASPRNSWRGFAATALLSASLAGAVVWNLAGRGEAPPASVVRASFPVGAPIRAFNQNRQIAISPDGSMIGALTREGTIMLRRLDELTPVAVPGASDVTSLFFSPDSRHLGYTTETAIYVVPLAGGPSLPIAEGVEVSRTTPLTASWGEDGRVYYSSLDGIASVPATGGERRVIVERADAREPLMLPGQRYLLYTKTLTNLDEIRLHRVGDDPTGAADTQLTVGSAVRYLKSGHLLFARDSDLFAAAWDQGARQLSSEPVRVASGIAFLSDFAQYDISSTGTLIHYPSASVASTMGQLLKVGASGAASPLGSNARRYSDPRIAPDGQRIAFHIMGEDDDVWVLDASRDLLTRVTFDRREDETPAWSPEGTFLAYAGFARDGTDRVVLRRRADGGLGEEILLKSPHHIHVTDWSRDGRFIVLELVQDPRNRDDVAFLELDSDGKPKGGLRTLFGSQFAESSGRVSPDSKWIAYRSNESGLDQVYVQPFPEGGSKIQISSGGGAQPVWSHDGRALYFRAPRSVMVARVKDQKDLTFETPAALFEDRFARPQSISHTTYDAFRDGTLLFIDPLASPDADMDNAVILATFNWTKDFLARFGK